MIERDIVPVLPDFVVSKSENRAPGIFWKFLSKKRNLFCSVLAVLVLLNGSAQSLQARHKCYKVPAPPGIVGIISIPILIPFGSTMAAARSSETSGCDVDIHQKISISQRTNELLCSSKIIFCKSVRRVLKDKDFIWMHLLSWLDVPSNMLNLAG